MRGHISTESLEIEIFVELPERGTNRRSDALLGPIIRTETTQLLVGIWPKELEHIVKTPKDVLAHIARDHEIARETDKGELIDRAAAVRKAEMPVHSLILDDLHGVVANVMFEGREVHQ
jgi:hypothetical protein